MIESIIEKLENKTIAILGFGREGQSTYNYIRKHDKHLKLTILDARKIDIDDQKAEYKPFNDAKDLTDYDLIIKTPGIACINFPEDIKKRITSQMELLLEVNRKNVIGITGTKGKSTTSTLIYNIFKDQIKDTYLVGNIGVPVLDSVDEYGDSIIIAEMSSHQLETVNLSPHIGIILNLYLDHLVLVLLQI